MCLLVLLKNCPEHGRTLTSQTVETVEKPQELSGKIVPREVPRESPMSRGTSCGQISRQFLRHFHSKSDFRLQKPEKCVPQELSEYIPGFPAGLSVHCKYQTTSVGSRKYVGSSTNIEKITKLIYNNFLYIYIFFSLYHDHKYEYHHCLS